MKRIHKYFSLLVIFSIALITTFLLTNDVKEAKAASISLNTKSFTIENGHYKTLRLTGTTKKATWLSTNSKVATVSSSGRVTAKASGTTTIVANVGGKKLSCFVRVVQVSKKVFSLAPGQSQSLIVWGANNTLTWSSSNKNIATVSKDGKVTAKAPGKATIYANVNGKEILSKLTVLEMNHDSIVLEHGGKWGFVKTLKVEDNNQKITWSSSDPSVAVVNSSGMVTTRGAGTATITASVNGAKLTCEVKVLEISNQYVTLNKGETKTLNVFGTNNTITWTSYKKSVATVSKDGVVTPKSAGTATIVGNVDGRLVRAYVTVID